MAGKATVKVQEDAVDTLVDETLGDEDRWNDYVTENPCPPLVVKGIRLTQPSTEAVEEWTRRLNEPDSDAILMGEENYKKLKAAFAKAPFGAWRNFQRDYMTHMFGSDDMATLGK